MKTNLIKEIETHLSDYELLAQFLATHKVDYTNKFSTIKAAAAHSKKTDCLLTAMKLNDFLFKYFNESFPFSESIQVEIDQYKAMIGVTTISNNDVQYSEEYSKLVQEMEKQINQINGN